MINLFNIPNYTIDTSIFNHYLHGDIVEEFESNFRDYVGAKYSCTVSSATNAIFLALLNKNTTINIPSMIPPVVCNAILTSGNKINFVDNTTWVGDSYVLHKFDDYKIIDSAQKVDLNQFKKEANDEDLMIFSFYPTKPVGSSDGGIIVSNDEEKIKWFKEATMNGMSYSHNNWDRKIKFPGFKMYMSSIQCYIANENLKLLDYKKRKLKKIRDFYNNELGYNNTSSHLYRIKVNNNKKFIKDMVGNGIICGIHYNTLHTNHVYNNFFEKSVFPNSDKESKQTVSIPFHERLDKNGQLEYIIKKIKRYE
jgi:dTDP-4-amino-4,6-dideoxygalactose transaminase